MGFVFDGATIPKFLWGAFGQGSPFVVDYRRATRIHDCYCRKENRHLARHEDVDRSFYEMMILADDVHPKERAQTIARVAHFFNRWPEPPNLQNSPCPNVDKK